MIYIERPAFAVFPLVLLVWQVLLYVLRKHALFSTVVGICLTGIGAVGHAVAITVILLSGGSLSDVLLLVLGSGALALALSPPPQAEGETKEEKR